MDKNTLLQNVRSIGGVEGTMISKRDGLVVDNAVSGFEDVNMLGAVVSSMFTQVESQSKRMQRGTPVRFTIETDNEMMSISNTEVDGENVLLFTQLSKSSDLDLVNSSLDLMRS